MGSCGRMGSKHLLAVLVVVTSFSRSAGTIMRSSIALFTFIVAPCLSCKIGSRIHARQPLRRGRAMAMITPFQHYHEALTSYPLMTNCVTAATLSVVSDCVAQTVSRKKPAHTGVATLPPNPHSWQRSSWMAVWGFVISGLLCNTWFRWLNRIFPPEGLTLRGAAKKVLVNQIIMSPTLNALFFTFTTFTRSDVSEKQSRSDILRDRLSQDLIPTIKKSCLYWGSIQFINFLYVPTMFTLLYTNAGFLLWTIYLSLVGFKSLKAPPTSGS